MSVRSKATGAAIKVAAPEAAVAAKAAGAAGGKGGRRKAPLPDPRQSAPGSKAARDRQAVEDIKARRKPEEPPADDEHQDDEHQDDAGDGPSLNPFGGMQGPATGGGFVLGLLVWAVVRAWIGNPGQPSGAAGVKALANAKLFNKTTGGAK